MSDENILENVDQYQGYNSIPYGPQVIRQYMHPSKYCDFQDVIHNSKTQDYVILDSRGISTWHAMTSSSRAVERVMEFEAYRFNTLRCIVYSRFYNLYFALTKDFGINVYNLNFHEIYHIDGDGGSVSRLLYNNKRHELITVCRSKVKCWKYVIREMQPTLVLHRDFEIAESLLLSSAEFDEELQRIYVLSDCNIYCYSTDGQLYFHMKAQSSMAYFCVCAFSTEANLLVAGSINGQLSIYNPTGGLVTTLLNHSKIITAIAIHLKDGNMFLSSSMDGTVRLFSLQMLDEIYSINVFPEGILFMRTHVSNLLYVASRKGVQLYDLNYSFRFWSTARAPVRRMNVTHRVAGLRQYVVVFTTDNCIRLYNKQTGQRRSTVLPPPEIAIGRDVISIAFDRQGRVLYILFKPLHVWIYSTRTDPATRVATWDLQSSIRESSEFNQAGRMARGHQQQHKVMSDDEVKFGTSRRSRKNAEENITCCSLATIRRDVFQTEPLSSSNIDGGGYLNFDFLLCGLSNGEVSFLDPCQSGCVVKSFKAHPTSPVIDMSVAYHCDDKCSRRHSYLMTVLGTVDGNLIRLWDVGLFNCFYQIFLHPNYTQLSYKRSRLVVGLSTGHIQTDAISNENGHVEEAACPKQLSSPGKMKEHDGAVLSIDISDSRDVFCSAGADHFVRVWNYNKELISEIKLDHTLKYAIFLTNPERILVSFKLHLFVVPHNVIFKEKELSISHDDDDESSGDESVIFEDPFVKGGKSNKAGGVSTINLATYLVPYPYLGLESLWMFQKALGEFTGLEEIEDEHSSVSSESSTDSLGSLASTAIYRDSSCDEDGFDRNNIFVDENIQFPSCNHTPEPEIVVQVRLEENDDESTVKIVVDEQSSESTSSGEEGEENEGNRLDADDNGGSLYDRIRKKTDMDSAAQPSINGLKTINNGRNVVGSVGGGQNQISNLKSQRNLIPKKSADLQKKKSRKRTKKIKSNQSRNLFREYKSRSKIDESSTGYDSDSRNENIRSSSPNGLSTFPTYRNDNVLSIATPPPPTIASVEDFSLKHSNSNAKNLPLSSQQQLQQSIYINDALNNNCGTSNVLIHNSNLHSRGASPDSNFSTHQRSLLSMATGKSGRAVSHSYQNVLRSLTTSPEPGAESKSSRASSAVQIRCSSSSASTSLDDENENSTSDDIHDNETVHVQDEGLKATRIVIRTTKKKIPPNNNNGTTDSRGATKIQTDSTSQRQHRRNSDVQRGHLKNPKVPKQYDRRTQQLQQQLKDSAPNPSSTKPKPITSSAQARGTPPQKIFAAPKQPSCGREASSTKHRQQQQQHSSTHHTTQTLVAPKMLSTRKSVVIKPQDRDVEVDSTSLVKPGNTQPAPIKTRGLVQQQSTTRGSSLSKTLTPQTTSASMSSQQEQNSRKMKSSNPFSKKMSIGVTGGGKAPSRVTYGNISSRVVVSPSTLSSNEANDHRSNNGKKSLRSITEKHFLSKSTTVKKKDSTNLFADFILNLHAKARRKRMILKNENDARFNNPPRKSSSSSSAFYAPPVSSPRAASSFSSSSQSSQRNPNSTENNIISVEIRPSQTELHKNNENEEEVESEEKEDQNNNKHQSGFSSRQDHVIITSQESKLIEMKTASAELIKLDEGILKISPVKANNQLDDHKNNEDAEEEQLVPISASEESKDVVKFILSSFKKPKSPVKSDRVYFEGNEEIQTVDSVQTLMLKRSETDSPQDTYGAGGYPSAVSLVQSNQSGEMSPVTCVVMRRHCSSEMSSSDDENNSMMMMVDSSDSLLNRLNRRRISKQRRREKYQTVQDKRSAMSGYETCSRDSMARSPDKEVTFGSTSFQQSYAKQRLSIKRGPLSAHQHHRQAPKSAPGSISTTSEIVYYKGYNNNNNNNKNKHSSTTKPGKSKEWQTRGIGKHERIRDLEKKLSGQKHRCYTPKSECEMEADRLTLLMMKKQNGVKVPVTRTSASIPVRCHYKLVKNSTSCQ